MFKAKIFEVHLKIRGRAIQIEFKIFKKSNFIVIYEKQRAFEVRNEANSEVFWNIYVLYVLEYLQRI